MVPTPAMTVFRRVTTLEGAGLDSERERRGREERGGEGKIGRQTKNYFTTKFRTSLIT